MRNIVCMFLALAFITQNIFEILYGNGGLSAWLWLGAWIILGALHSTLYTTKDKRK